jgi:hypothetical protein
MAVIIAWLSLMAIGLTLTLWLLNDALADRRALLLAGVTNGRKIIAASDVRSAIVRVAMFVFFVIAGVVALLRAANIMNANGLITQITLLIGAGLLIGDAWIERRTRQILLSRPQGGS